MMKARLLTPLLFAAVATLVAAGCGGGKSRSTAYSGSQDQYAAALDSICSATNAAGKSLDLSSTSALASNGDKAKDLLDKMVDKIDGLEPPAAVKDRATSFVAGLKKEAGEFGDLTRAAKDADENKIKEIQGQLQSESAATSEDARFIGATGCARLFS
jgi:hypothetical protein